MTAAGGGPGDRRGSSLASWGIAVAVLVIIALVVLAPNRDREAEAPPPAEPATAEAAAEPRPTTDFPLRTEPGHPRVTPSGEAPLPANADPDREGEGQPGL